VLSGGKAAVSGSTATYTDEFSNLLCGVSFPLSGPQAYYKVGLVGGKTYRFAITSSFKATFYLFSSSAACQQAGIEADCASKGKSGDVVGGIPAGSTQELFFQAPMSTTYYLAVDSADAAEKGSFALEVGEHTAPSNSACASPQPLSLAGGKITVQGSTAGVLDEFPTVKCGGSTSFAGPQLYYSLALTAGQPVKISLTATFPAYLYVFSASGGCTLAAIETYCASGGATGGKIGPVVAGSPKSFYFSPAIADTYLVAIDSSSISSQGSFTLEVESYAPAQNGTCQSAKLITLSGGKATESGTTGGIADEFPALACGGYSTFGGPQAYYQVAMSQGKGYKLTLTPTFYAFMVLFSSAAGCGLAGMDSDCKSKGATGDKFGGSSSSATYYFVPSKSDTYVIGIDSTSSANQGDFTLEVEEFALPPNGVCSGAETLSLQGGSATVTGNTAVGVKDEFAALKCGGASTLAGPQLYYRVALAAGKTYRLKFRPTFSGTLYLFPDAATCQLAAMEFACASQGVSGAKLASVSPNATRSLYFTPTTAGTYVIGVDSLSSYASGSFVLNIDEIAPAQNGTCTSAASLSFANHAITVEGDTYGVSDEFPTVKCGLGGNLDGPQVYYAVSLTATTSYRMILTSTFSAYLAIFSSAAACQPAGIDQDCGSAGKTGDKLAVPSTSKIIAFTPSTTGTYYLVVDSQKSSVVNAGYFKLAVVELVPPVVPTFTAPFTWDFETDCKGLGATGDWECGKLSWSPGPNCTGSETPPMAGHSGLGMWGTKLNDCYSPLNNAATPCLNTDPFDDSTLSFKVSIPASWTSAELTYFSWDDYFLSYDWTEVRIDGTPVKQTCKSGAVPDPPVWTKNTVDLTPYLGKSITVEFHFMASDSTNLAGWYLDDLSVTGK
jgi:hypothetical protein